MDLKGKEGWVTIQDLQTMSQIARFCRDIKPLIIPFLIDRMEILFNWFVEEKKNKEGTNKKKL